MTSKFTMRSLSEKDVLGDFRSGVEPLDRFLHCYAKQNQRRSLSRTWLAVGGSEIDIAGYVTFVGGSALPDLLAPALRNLPGYEVPVLKLARMATELKYRGQGVGSKLLQLVVATAVEQAKDTGCAGILTDAKPASEQAPDAAGFYGRFGFVVVRPPSDADPTTGMFLTLAKAQALLPRTPPPAPP